MDYDSDVMSEWSENDASEFMYENFFAELLMFAEDEDELEIASDAETEWDCEEDEDEYTSDTE